MLNPLKVRVIGRSTSIVQTETDGVWLGFRRDHWINPPFDQAW